MTVIRAHHRERAQVERGMADASATNMARIIHNTLADMHLAVADRPRDAACREKLAF